LTEFFAQPGICSTPGPVRFVVVAPVYNHGGAVGAVLTALGKTHLPIIVVNDGSTDATRDVLAGWLADGPDDGRRDVCEHRKNRGKASALRTGFGRAAARGFTHVVTIDTDGQHDPAEIERLCAAAAGAPRSLVIGVRELGDVAPPLASRIGRAVSNRLVWWECGVRISDSQSGMRVYPLDALAELDGGASRYGFETQVISRAGWSGVAIIEVAIRCIYEVPGGRTTHFRLVFDTVLAVRMHAALLARALFFVAADKAGGVGGPMATGSIPGRLLRWISPVRLLRMARGESGGRERLAASVGTGLAMATLPLYGIKTLLCMWLSARFRLHPLAVISVSSLSTPPIGFLFIAASIFAGHVMVHGSRPGLELDRVRTSGVWEMLGTLTVEWVVGSLVVATVLGLVGYGLVRVALSRVPQRMDDVSAAEGNGEAEVKPLPQAAHGL